MKSNFFLVLLCCAAAAWGDSNLYSADAETGLLPTPVKVNRAFGQKKAQPMKTIVRQFQDTIAKTILILCAASCVSSLQAGQPEIIRIDETSIDEGLSEHCGFPVQLHVDAKLTFNYGENSVTASGSWKGTWTNLETGQTVVGNNSIRIHQVETVSEGQIILNVVTSGPGFLKAPHGGIAYMESGRFGFRVVLDAESGEFSVWNTQSTNHAASKGNFPIRQPQTPNLKHQTS